MDGKIETLLTTLAEQGVSVDDRSFWRTVFMQDTTGQVYDQLSALLVSHPEQSGWMRGMIEKKAQAIKNNNESVLVALVEEELSHIEAL